MKTPQEPKRIVSKAHYVQIMGQRWTAKALALSVITLGIAGLGAAVGVTCIALCVRTPWYFELVSVSLGLVAGLLYLAGKAGLEAVQTAETVMPLTRQTASELPDADSLVRASSMDTIASESVLLRPAHKESQTDSDELLRPHGGE